MIIKCIPELQIAASGNKDTWLVEKSGLHVERQRWVLGFGLRIYVGVLGFRLHAGSWGWLLSVWSCGCMGCWALGSGSLCLAVKVLQSGWCETWLKEQRVLMLPTYSRTAP